MARYRVGDTVTPFRANKGGLWGEIMEIRRWGRGYSCRVRWDPELWRLDGRKHPREGWHPQTKLWATNLE